MDGARDTLDSLAAAPSLRKSMLLLEALDSRDVFEERETFLPKVELSRGAIAFGLCWAGGRVRVALHTNRSSI